MKKYLSIVVALLLAFTLTACGGKKDYKEYTGYAFEGQDPWGNPLSINFKELKDDKYTWTYNVVIGEGEYALTFSGEFTNEIDDGVIEFDIKGTALEDPNNSYEYTGTLTLKDEKVIVKYEEGEVTESSPEGGSSAYQVGGLEEGENEVTLKKVEAK